MRFDLSFKLIFRSLEAEIIFFERSVAVCTRPFYLIASFMWDVCFRDFISKSNRQNHDSAGLNLSSRTFCMRPHKGPSTLLPLRRDPEASDGIF